MGDVVSKEPVFSTLTVFETFRLTDHDAWEEGKVPALRHAREHDTARPIFLSTNFHSASHPDCIRS